MKQPEKKADFLICFYEKVRKKREIVEIGYLFLMVAIFFLYIPWLSSDYEPTRIKIGLLALGAVSIVIEAFFVIPCSLFEMGCRDEKSEKVSSSNDICERFPFFLNNMLALIFYICFSVSGIHYQLREGGVQDVWVWAAIGWLLLCIIGGVKVFRKIAIYE